MIASYWDYVEVYKCIGVAWQGEGMPANRRWTADATTNVTMFLCRDSSARHKMVSHPHG